MKKVVLLVILMLCGLYVTQHNFTILASGQDWVFDLGQFRDSAYHRTLSRWKLTEDIYEGSDLMINIEDQAAYNPGLLFDEETVLVLKRETIRYRFIIEEAGLYHIRLDFAVESSFSTAPTITMKINDEIPFNEMSQHGLGVLFELNEREEDEKYNRFGNELLPHTEAITGLYRYALSDNNGRYSEAFYFKLEAGINELEFEAINQNIRFGDLAIFGKKEGIDYQTYYNQVKHYLKSDDLIRIEGQDIHTKNDIEIKSSYFKGPSMSPSSYRINVLNILDGSSMVRSGMAVDYQFEVETSGLYQLSFKYLQRDMVGMSSARRISLNGLVPFEELNAYLFPYVNKWTNHTLGNADGSFWFYLESGLHTLSMEVTRAHLSDDIDRLASVMDGLNSLGFAIAQITGNSKDPLIDWDILRYLPDIKETLIGYANTLDEIYEKINDMTPSSRRASAISTLEIASKQLRRLAKFPNRIPNKLSELNVGSGSAYQLIGVAVNQMNIQPIDIDLIYVYGDDIELPRAHPNIFKRFFFSVSSFVYSFFDERYKLTSNPNDDVLEVWIGQSSLFLDIMQNMIDDEFTRDYGIDVRLSVLPSTQRIILNNATGTNPDVVLSIDSWEPYQYALRGMLADLSTFDGFAEMVEPYHANGFTPMIFEEGVYGIPETQGIYMLFYRKDILSFLGLTPPDTWDDILAMLPILQSYQMNFFHPLGGEGAYKGFGLTSPFIYQFGGEIYTGSGMTTTLNQEEVIEAITFMTDIFNVYNLPQQVPSFFEHFRSGSLPVGIATADMYLQLKYAAPELQGQWGMLPIPGIYDASLGEVARWAPTYGKASILFEASNMKQEGFELIQWWNQAETQLKFLETVKMVLGERYLFLPANLDALADSIWDDDIKNISLLQARWSRIPAITPGSYIVERELTNIWNKIVIDQINPRVAIDQSIPRINRELMRKYEEFGYYKGGVMIRAYTVPRNDNIHHWIP
jgi:ABC-type glycerol-3-phosphate transport system substrate-binding protein